CMTAIVSPEGNHLVPPLTSGEGILVADLDMALITKRKRMMDSVGHYARPELLSLVLNEQPARPMHGLHPNRLMPTPPAASDDTADTAGSPQGDADRATDQRVAVLRSAPR